LYQKSRVIDIIRYFSELKNVHANQAIENGVEWLKRLEISQYKDRKLEELSKGNQQKIQFITAILHNPDVLILDEPFSGFDPINQQLIKDIILSYVDNGKTMILSTHQMDMAEKLCDEIFLIDKGKEVVGGNINEVRKKYGKNSIRVDFSGDKSLISSIPGIVEINVYSNYAEIELNESTKPSEILKKLVDIVEIRNFTILEPSLNKIFIDLIKKSSE